MKVHELISILQKADPLLNVAVQGYEGGFCDLKKKAINQRTLVLNVNEENFYGPQELDDSIYIGETKAQYLILARS
jgi:hypothetical protein